MEYIRPNGSDEFLSDYNEFDIVRKESIEDTEITIPIYLFIIMMRDLEYADGYIEGLLHNNKPGE